MTVYRIEIKQSAKKELAQLPKTIAEKIAMQIKALADNPRPNGCKKLVGTEHSYRIRINDYRVLYSIFDQELVIQVIKLGHRRDIYR
ncbi:MAG: type II toxin-antitoxin system RelE family toxin [Methylococcaceae bacterium]